MDMGPTISVIIPAYNVEQYITRCVKSVMNQTYKNLEIILVDDGSTDGTGIICDNMAESDKRIIVIHQENLGLSCARNAGIDGSSGSWIAFLDSDDWIEPDMYVVLYHNAMSTDCLISSCDSIDIVDGLRIEKDVNHELRVYDIQAIMQGLLTKEHIRFEVWNKLWNRDLIGQIRFIPKQISEDVYFDRILFLKAGKMVHVNEIYHNYVINRPGNTNATFKQARLKTLKEFEQFALDLENMNLCKESRMARALLIRYLMTIFVEAKRTKQNQEIMSQLYKDFKKNYTLIKKDNELNKLSLRIFNINPSVYYVLHLIK